MKKNTRAEKAQLKSQAILKAAASLFVKSGYAGTSMSEIAKEAKVTQSLIHHYFGSKKELWAEVKRTFFSRYIENQEGIMDKHESSPVKLLEQTLRQRFEFFRNNPDVSRFLSWMELEQDTTGLEDGDDLFLSALKEIRHAQSKGIIRENIDPKYILSVLISMTNYWFRARHFFQHWFSLETQISTANDEPIDDQTYLDEALNIFFRGILNPKIE